MGTVDAQSQKQSASNVCKKSQCRNCTELQRKMNHAEESYQSSVSLQDNTGRAPRNSFAKQQVPPFNAAIGARFPFEVRKPHLCVLTSQVEVCLMHKEVFKVMSKKRTGILFAALRNRLKVF